jgi:hypothetical protein
MQRFQWYFENVCNLTGWLRCSQLWAGSYLCSSAEWHRGCNGVYEEQQMMGMEVLALRTKRQRTAKQQLKYSPMSTLGAKQQHFGKY